MSDENKKSIRLTWGVIVSLLGLAGSGFAYVSNAVADIAYLQEFRVNQRDVNAMLLDEIKILRHEQRETGKEYNAKLDVIIDRLNDVRSRRK